MNQASAKGLKPVIGLAGGIAAGKSLVARMLSELGAGVIDADELNHQVLHRDAVRRQIQSWWGQNIYDRSGKLDRRNLAAIVFADPAKRRKLEQLTHPLIDELQRQRMDQLQADHRYDAIVLDVPLLFEVGQDKLCDQVLFVEVDERVRNQRAIARRGWSESELCRREKTQQSLDLKRQRSDHVLENNSDTDSLRRQVATFYQRLTTPP